MIQNISDYIRGWARGWLVLSLIAVFFLIINLPIGDPVLISTSLDARIGYTPEQAFLAISSYGNTGRTQMIWIHIGDFILIALYTSVFCLSISWLFKRSFKSNSKMQMLNLVPVVGGIFDVMENIWILTMILIYPTKSLFIGSLSTIFTTGKYIMGLIIISLLLFGIVKAATNRHKEQDYEVT